MKKIVDKISGLMGVVKVVAAIAACVAAAAAVWHEKWLESFPEQKSQTDGQPE